MLVISAAIILASAQTQAQAQAQAQAQQFNVGLTAGLTGTNLEVYTSLKTRLPYVQKPI
jgi:regulator of protease activity HflC (stomatin/prohibitin superfamily)